MVNDFDPIERMVWDMLAAGYAFPFPLPDLVGKSFGGHATNSPPKKESVESD